MGDKRFPLALFAGATALAQFMLPLIVKLPRNDAVIVEDERGDTAMILSSSSPLTRRSRSLAKVITDLFQDLKRPLIVCGLISVVVNILLLASPLFMLQIYDRVLASRSLPTLVTLTSLLAACFLGITLLEIVRARMLNRAAAHFTTGLSGATFSAIVDEELAKTSQYGNQPLQDLQSIRQFATGPGLAVFFDMPWVPIYLLFGYLLHPAIGMMTAAAALVLVALAIANERATARVSAEAAGEMVRSHRLFEGARRGAEVLRAMAMEGRYGELWTTVFGSAQATLVCAGDRASAFHTCSKHLRLFLQSGCLALGAALAIRGEVSAGSIIAASIIMARALAPVEQATGQWTQLQGARSAFRRLESLIAKHRGPPVTMVLPEPKGELNIENVAIVAPGGTTPILSRVNLALSAGEAMAVVGPSGSGKSSLARAIAGVWPAATGEIRLDGALLATWPREQLGNAIGYVPQDVELFAGTIAENISRFEPSADPSRIIAAAQRANVHDMILRMKDGYMTQIGEGGCHLSGGQQQRIALARALYGGIRLLVLDEPNSNLDDAGETALSEALAALRKEGVTVVLVSHRPQCLKAVDKILVLRDGLQVAFAPRDEILMPAAKITPLARTQLAASTLSSVR